MSSAQTGPLSTHPSPASPASPARVAPARSLLVLLSPLILALLIALVPAPAGLSQHSWYYVAIFAAVIAGLIVEPIPAAAVGLVGVVTVAALAQLVLFAPDQLARPGFNATGGAIAWALSGFSNATVWLIFAAFIFSLGYEKTGLGRRISLLLVSRLGGRTLTLGYAVAIADGILAPFTPSNTARSGGTIFPVVKNLPGLYASLPNDPSSRRIGGYLMWTAIAATCVTSSMFLTGLAPNLLAVELVRKTVQVNITWMQWFLAFLPVGAILLLATPWLAYKLYPPEVRTSPEVQSWAREELRKLGPLTRRECVLVALVVAALGLWIFGTGVMDPATAAILVVALLVVTRTVSWDDILSNKPAWNTLVWFGTLVPLAGGLVQVGVVKWLAGLLGGGLAGVPAVPAMLALVLAFFLLHYLFASVTAHVTALLPVMLTVGAAIPGMPMEVLALLLCLSLGIMGIISPFATGPSPIYAGSGYLPAADYWRLGGIFGFLYLLTFLLVGVPLLLLTH
ncbi:DASS family sodium-coupled anion symporter [Roseicella aquatilis]|uniref:DASS family sodium-coupled anion symporter n=1 Tax=Roseicella aquatilis TaxID=2527868 RepID=A0A4R4DQ86_9PROT|nr:DASS family sodium-coupled anion symporter [Roseicella aquatilis]TCZ63243.1 DASS family sodium-coupled anion symporter [Roseicella aquatilis]